MEPEDRSLLLVRRRWTSWVRFLASLRAVFGLLALLRLTRSPSSPFSSMLQLSYYRHAVMEKGR